MKTGKQIIDTIVTRMPVIKLWSSVRVKFVIIIVALLLVVISSVATALAVAIIRPYKDLLSNSLLLQTKILLDNLELRMHRYLSEPTEENVNLLLLNRVTFPEAKYVVITGKSSDPAQEGIQYVLTTDYKDINKLITTYRYVPGVSQFCPDGIDEILQKMTSINNEATELVQQHALLVKKLTDRIG